MDPSMYVRMSGSARCTPWKSHERIQKKTVKTSIVTCSRSGTCRKIYGPFPRDESSHETESEIKWCPIRPPNPEMKTLRPVSFLHPITGLQKSVCLSISLSVCLFVGKEKSWNLKSPAGLSVCPSVSLCLSVRLSVYLSVRRSVCLFVCP